ncbi:TDRD6 [Branchiostoma lanceolatum]|uniref:TDRD6 protein n=1 Tax=Branchiostoma lanceolatum TaxID=7740 RepID=A0A8K0ELY7_BRALA|nr:TDRD6 [Branchiostoma lanceolatum]
MESNKLFSPEIGTRLSAYITSVDTTSRVVKLWAQVDQENANNLENAMENLQQSLEASDNSLNLNKLQVGDLCCAKFEQDARWYRARVVSKCPGDRSVTVLFVDYGNIEVVDISKTTACPAEVASIPAQASECFCTGVEAAADGVWSTEAASFLAEQADTEVSMKVVKVVHDKSIVVEAFQGSEGDGQSLSEVLIQKGFACRNKNVQQGLKNVTLPVGAKERIYMSHIVSPHQFWIQLHSHRDDITELMEGIFAHKHEMDTPASVLRDIQTGSICAALSIDDATHMYYRGIVKSIVDDNTADVFFVDYGDSQNTSLSDIKYLRPEFSVLPAQAIECTLKDIQPNPEWTKEAKEYFELVTLDKELVGEAIGKSSDGKMYVQLKEQRGGLTLDIRDMLIKEGFAKSTKEGGVDGFQETKLEFGKEYEMYVTDARGPGDFTCQLPESFDLIDTIAEELQNLSQTAKEVRSCEIKPSKACMAKFSEDNCWYRAKVSSLSTTGDVKVRFVDFGNTETVSANVLKELNPRMAEIPAQSIECSLPNIGTPCSKEAKEEFKKLVMDKPLTGKVVVITGGKHVLELTEKSTGSPVSIAEQMAKAGFTPAPAKPTSLMNGTVSVEKDCPPVPKPPSSATSPRRQSSRLQYKLPTYSPGSQLDGHVMSVVNIGEFYCTPVQESPELLELMDKLHEYYSRPDAESLRDPRPGTICCAQFTEDDGWYRAVIRKVTDKGVLVRYVDYGNCETVEMSRVKALNPDFTDLPPQCFEACLIDVVPTKSTLAPEFTKNFVDLVKDEPVKIKLFSRDQGGRYTVDLTKDNKTASNVMKAFMRGRAIPVSPPPTPGILLTDAEFIQPFVEEGMYQDVFVTDATDPDVFWCQLLSSTEELNTLMEDMSKHYSQLNQEEEALHTCGLEVPCVAKYTLDEQWYRAVITGVCKSGDVEVRFVDYGNAELVSRVNVKAIKVKYMQLPVQAIQCSLLGVLCKNDMWTERQMQQFSQMVLEKEFVAQIVAREELENRYEIELFDHRGKNVNNEYGRVTQTLVSRRDHVKPPPKQLPVIPAPGAAATAVSKGYVMPQQVEVGEGKEDRESLAPSSSKHTDEESLTLISKEETEQPAASDSSGSTESVSSTVSQQSVYVTAPSTLTADSRSSSCVSLASSASSRKGSVDFNQLQIKKGTTEELALTHAVTPNQFFCQLLRDFQDIEDLSEKLQQFYSSDEFKESFISDPEVGMRCCALYSEDSMWYRALITDVLDQQVEVKFVDFGNTEMLDLTEIRVLDERFAVAPAYAVECSVAHVKPTSGTWSAKAIEKFSSLTEEKTLVGMITSVSTRGKALLELRDADKSVEEPSLNQELVQAGFAREATPSVSSRNTTPASSKTGSPTSSRPVTPQAVDQTAALTSTGPPNKIVYEELSYSDGSVVDVMVSLFVSPSEFWCQPVPSYNELSKLMEDMGTYYNSGEKELISNPEVGQDCVARFSEDNDWYRAKVTQVMGNEVEVRYVDYGNSEKRLKTDLRLSKPDYSKLAQQAFKCSLQEKISPYDGVAWSNKALGHLQRLVIDKELKCVISGKQTNKEDVPLYFADLTCKQHISITQKMIEAQLARPATSKSDAAPAKDTVKEAASNPTLPPDPEVKVGLSGIAVVSDGDDPLKFWCQRTSQGSKLDEMMDAIDAHCSSEDAEEVGKLKPGHAVIAKYSVDQGWYRAEMKEAVSPRQYILQFIDYGNQEQVSKSNMRILKPEFALLPKQAFPCYLSKVEVVTPEAKAKFAELTAEAQLKLIIVDKKQDRFEVELENPESALQVNKEILKITATASHCNEPENLQQKAEKEKGPSIATSNQNETESQLPTPTSPKYPPVVVQTGGTVPVYISHCETPAKFWVQVADQEPQLNKLMEAVETSAQNGTPLASTTQLNVGDPCCAQFSEDNGWYRGRIKDISEEGKLGIHFVDYGNQEVVPLEKVQEPHADLLKQPPFAFECVLDGAKPAGTEWSTVASSWFKEVTIERVLQAEFLDTKEPVRVKLSDGSEDIGKNMVKRGHAVQDDTEIKTETSEASVDHPAPVAEVSSRSLPELKEVDLSEGSNVEVYVAVTWSPSDFWCQLASTTSELDSLMEKICDHYASVNSEETLQDPKQGMPCIAQFSEDKGWYRAKVIKVEGDVVEVIFVDYGNSEKVEKSLVKVIKSQFTDLPIQAFQCSLANITPPGSVWDNDTTAKFTQLCTSQEDAYVIRVLGKDGHGLHTVELAKSAEALKKGDTVGKQLLADKLAKPTDSQDTSGDATATTATGQTKPQSSPPEEEEELLYKSDSVKAGDRMAAYISFMDKSNHIWCQKVEQSDALGELMDTIDTHCSNLKDEEDTLNMPREQTACLAQYSEDGGWYRAKVVEVKEGSVTVQFVDFGNTEEVASSKVKQMKAEFMELPELAYECVLKGIPAPWEMSLVKRFSDLTNDKALTVDVQDIIKRDKKQVLEVILLDGDLSVNEALTQERQKPVETLAYKQAEISEGESHSAYISSVVGPTKFYIQMEGAEEVLEGLMEKIQHCEHLSTPSLDSLQAGTPVLAMYTADDQWYRAQVLSIEENAIKVLYVDFGNSESVGLERLKAISPEFLVTPSQALECTLGKEASDLPEDITTVMQGLTDVLTIKFLHQDGQKWAVEVFQGETSVKDMVLKVGKEELQEVEEIAVKTSTPSKDETGDSLQSVDPEVSAIESLPQATNFVYAANDIDEGELQEGYISHTTNPSLFFVQLAMSAGKLDTLMKEINEEYGSLGTRDREIADIKPGMPCMVPFSEEGEEVWYRGRVQFTNHSVSVYYIDYGSEAVVPAECVKSIPPKFMTLPGQAVACTLSDVSPVDGSWPEGAIEKFLELTEERQLMVEFNKRHGSGWNVRLLDGEESIGAKLTTEGTTKESQTVETTPAVKQNETPDSGLDESQETVSSDVKAPPESHNTVIPALQIEPGTEETVYYLCGETPDNFSCQLVSAETQQNKLAEDIANLCAVAVEPLSTPLEGQTCLAQFSVDDQWYRAVITAVTQQGCNVRFVDYGNTEVVPSAKLRPLPVELSQLPRQAIPCRLAALVPMADKWSDQAIQAFQDACIEKELKAKFDSKCDDKFDVVLYDPSETDDSSINQKMVTLGHAKAQTKPGKEEPNSVQLDPVSNQLQPVPTQFEPVSVPTQFEPVSVPTQFEPVSVPTQLEPVSVPTQLEPVSIPTQFEPVSVPTQLEPVSVPTQLEPVSDPSEDISSKLESESQQTELPSGEVALNSEELEPPMPQVQSVNGEKEVVSELDKSVSERAPDSNKLELVADKAESVSCQAEPVSDQADVVSDKLEPVTNQTETMSDQTELCANLSDSVLDQTELIFEKSEPVFDKVEPVSDQPDSVCDQTKSALEQSESVSDQEEPLPEKAKLVIDQVESVSGQPEPDQKESVPDQSELITDQKEPKGETDQTESMSDLPGQVTDQAVSMLGQQEMVVEQAKRVPDQMEPVSDQPELVTDEAGSVSGQSEPVTDQMEEVSGQPELVTDEARSGQSEPVTNQLVGDEVSEGPCQATAEEKSEDLEDATPTQYKKPHLSMGEEVDFYFLSAEDPDNMVLQPVQSEQDLNNLAQKISNIYDRLAASDLQLKDVLPGSVCCAKFTDGLWYRAEVVSVESNQVTVYFVDYGNTETVDSCDVRKLHSELADLPTQAVHCGISGIEATSGTWSCQVKEALEELCSGGVVRGVVADREDDGKVLLGTCTVEGVDIVQQLMDRRLATKEGEPEGSEVSSEPQDTGSEAVSTTSEDDVESCTPSETEGSIRLAARQVKAGDQLNVVVTNVVSPDQFWCQDVEADLPRMNAYCQSCPETVQSPKVNDLCCALYSEDQTWYRAKILDVVSSKMLTVQFIDFGSLETVSPVNTRPLDAEMTALPPCALECSMSEIQCRTTDTGKLQFLFLCGWSDEAVLFFEDLVQDKTFRLLVDEVTSEGTAKVELYSECEEKTVSQLMVVSGHARRKAGSVQSGSMDSLSGYTGTSTAESVSPAPGSEAGEQMEKGEGHMLNVLCDSFLRIEFTVGYDSSPITRLVAASHLSSCFQLVANLETQWAGHLDTEETVQPAEEVTAEQVEETVMAQELAPDASEADVELQSTAVAVQKPAAGAGDTKLQDPAAAGAVDEGHSSQAEDVKTVDVQGSEMGSADSIVQTLTVPGPSGTTPSCLTPTNRPSVSSFYTPVGEVSLSFATDRALSPSSVLEVTGSEWTTFEETVESSPESGSQQEDSSVSPADDATGDPARDVSVPAADGDIADEEQLIMPCDTLPTVSDIKAAVPATSVENGTPSEMNGTTEPSEGKEMGMGKQEVHTNGDVETIGEQVYQV